MKGQSFLTFDNYLILKLSELTCSWASLAYQEVLNVFLFFKLKNLQKMKQQQEQLASHVFLIGKKDNV